MNANERRIAVLAGNPNSGKTTLFNALTGLRQKVGNYAGVTVERKTGVFETNGAEWSLIDLPGAYSLTARSPEETIARKALRGEMEDLPKPNLAIIVVDASNLDRNLYLATQILNMGVPSVIALNMMDQAETAGAQIDADILAAQLGAPVVPMIATRGEGVEELKAAAENGASEPPMRPWRLDDESEAALSYVSLALGRVHKEASDAELDSETVRLVAGGDSESTPPSDEAAEAVAEARNTLSQNGHTPETFEAQARHRWIRSVTAKAVGRSENALLSRSDRIDSVLTHRVFGPLILLAAALLAFQAIFSWASIPMDWIDAGVSALGGWVGGWMPEGALSGLIVDGVIAGVGSVVIFLPQILFLFFFIGLLEDTGYMARAAFMMDRFMRGMGLHGNAFIPLLSSFACAIPGIMATRTISEPKDRLATILVAPLMACSARLPVYVLIIAAFIPGGAWAQSLSLTGLYLLGVLAAMAMAFLFKKTLLRGEAAPLILELPPYRLPNWRTLFFRLWDRSGEFIKRAGGMILAATIVLWFMASYPKLPADVEAAYETRLAAAETEAETGQIENERAEAAISNSFAARLGRWTEPALRPLGFDWRIGVGVIASFAAREVFVGAMGTLYGVGEADDDPKSLQERLEGAVWESGDKKGEKIYTLPTAVALLLFYVFALQCISTVAIMRRETNSWRWPAFAWVYMFILAYGFAWAGRFAVAAFI